LSPLWKSFQQTTIVMVTHHVSASPDHSTTLNFTVFDRPPSGSRACSVSAPG
jgi:hypothetical protein